MVLFRLFFTFSCLPIRYFVVCLNYCPFFGLDPKEPKSQGSHFKAKTIEN